MKSLAWIAGIASVTLCMGCTNMTPQQQGTMSGAANGVGA